MKLSTSFAATLALTALVACNRSDTPAVSAGNGLEVSKIEVGRSIHPDRTIDDETTSFKPADTIYASVLTEGSASDASLTARWTYEDGQPVSESSERISVSDEARTVFRVSKPDGWPEGDYRVEILLNGQVADSKEFEVDK